MTIESQASMADDRWYVLRAALHASGGMALEISEFSSARVQTTLRGHVPRHSTASYLCVGAPHSGASSTLNGRIGRISLTMNDRRAEWSFPQRGPRAALQPTSGDWGPLRIHNTPTFAVASPRWNGTVFDPRLAPSHYDAVHLHDDDMDSLDWPPNFDVRVPPDASSGVYAFEIRSAAGTERIPFFVRPRAPRASLVFLVPTATYWPMPMSSCRASAILGCARIEAIGSRKTTA